MSLWRWLLEPEETVGTLWHRAVGDAASYPRHPAAAVRLDDVRETLGVLFRGLGGEPGIRLRAATAMVTDHRRRRRQRLGAAEEWIVRARIDGDSLFLPPVVDWLPTPTLNTALYLWLTAWAAAADGERPAAAADPLAADLAFLAHAARVSRRALARFPGLAADYRRLADACRQARPVRPLPPVEAAVEAAIQALLGGPGEAADGSPLVATILAAIAGDGPPPATPKGYRPHLPVLVWGESLPMPPRAAAASADEPPPAGGGDPGGDERTRKGRRDEAPDSDRNDPLILNRFEKILSWAEFLRINRGVDDDDEDNARRAADDHAEITLVKHRHRAATRLKFDLDLSPADVDRERLAGRFLYPEWDYRRQAYLADHCRVLAGSADAGGDEPPPWVPDAAARRRIDAVRRQFEALRPKREILKGQIDGEDLDMDALIRSRCDLLATGDGSDRIYLQARQQARDLAVAVLIDVSRSTESYVDNRPVIDIAREALTALTGGLTAAGDDHAIFSFSSLRRERVWVETLKAFDAEPAALVHARIARLRPGHYTRLGAAVRHVSARLAERARQRRLLLVLTDGKPNDLDHYEGRYGIEDTARAIREARRVGHAVFGITIDRKAQAYFPHIFGRNAFAIVAHPAALTQALPLIYHHVVA